MNEQPQHFLPGKPREKATAPVPRPDRRFYAQTQAFGRFGIRWFDPQIMPEEHFHGHIELNWLTTGSMDYVIDGRPLRIPSGRLVADSDDGESAVGRDIAGGMRDALELPIDELLVAMRPIVEEAGSRIVSRWFSTPVNPILMRQHEGNQP